MHRTLKNVDVSFLFVFLLSFSFPPSDVSFKRVLLTNPPCLICFCLTFQVLALIELIQKEEEAEQKKGEASSGAV